MKKKEKMRELICACLNQLVQQDKINLDNLEDTSGEFFTSIYSKPTRISWEAIGYGEIRISVWWGVKPTCEVSRTTKPLNRRLADALDVCCSAWVERRDGKWIQGQGGDRLFDTYCSRQAEKALMSVPIVQGIGFDKEGKFYF